MTIISKKNQCVTMHLKNVIIQVLIGIVIWSLFYNVVNKNNK